MKIFTISLFVSCGFLMLNKDDCSAMVQLSMSGGSGCKLTKPHNPTYYPYDTKSAVKRTVVGAAVGAGISAIPSADTGTAAGAALGGSTGFLTHAAEWAYDNAGYGVNKAAGGLQSYAEKMHKLENPRG